MPRHGFSIRPHERRHPPLRERPDGLLPGVLGEEPNGRDGKVVVGVPEPGPTLLGEQEQLGGSTAASTPLAGGLARLCLVVGYQHIEMATHRRGTDAQLFSDGHGRQRSLLQQKPGDLVSGSTLGRHVRRGSRHGGWLAAALSGRPLLFHNIIVSYFREGGKGAP